MSKENKESLEKLLLFISDICEEDENEWFAKKLSIVANKKITSDKNIDSIYEYCIKEIIKDQALNFYKDFKLTEIKEKLIADFVRMEQFKREDNFEDFCLAMYQQTENIVNYLFEKKNLEKKTSENSNNFLLSRYDNIKKEFVRNNKGITIGNFIFGKYSNEHIDLNSRKWYYNNKVRAILYFSYFNEVIEYNTKNFESLNNTANELYQIRNLNHRGSNISEYNKKLYSEIVPNHNRYYFKFLGFLEDFITGINKNLS